MISSNKSIGPNDTFRENIYVPKDNTYWKYYWLSGSNSSLYIKVYVHNGSIMLENTYTSTIEFLIHLVYK